MSEAIELLKSARNYVESMAGKSVFAANLLREIEEYLAKPSPEPETTNSDEILFAPQSLYAHYCKCHKVERCSIFVHPSEEIQKTLNQLMDLIKYFDD
jgi:hypothetical protein